MRSLTPGLGLSLLSLVAAAPSPSPIESRQNNTPKNCNKAFFDNVVAQLKLGGSVDSRSPYTPNSEPFTAGRDPYRERVLYYANNDTPLRISDICGLRVNVVDNIAFELYLPSPETWNQRFLTVGNGGFAGGASRKDMFSRVVQNWATMSTNTGHDDPSLMLNWGAGTAGKKLQIDWAYRAMNLSVPYAKAIVAAYYGADKKTKGSYYSGCSTGGRQGIRQVEIDPKSFDAMLIGAPAWNIKSFSAVLSRIGYLAETSGLKVRLREATPTVLDRIWTLVYKECDGLDGSTTDGVILNRDACYARFRNQAENTTLWANTDTTVQQRKAFLTIIEEFKNPKVPEFVGHGFDITAIRDLGSSSYLMDKLDNLDFTQQFAQYFLNNPSLKWDTDDNGAALIVASEAWNKEVLANADPSVLSPGGKYTGKTILYTGTSDGFVSSAGTRRAFDLAGGKDNTNLAYFEIPGMPHCVDLGSGAVNPPWYIGGGGLHMPYPNSVYYMPESAGLQNPKNDALLALVDWVEQKGNTGPETLVATAFKTWGDGKFEVAKSRPVCRFPKQLRLVEGKNVNAVEGWECK